jgi:hypothetical protein
MQASKQAGTCWILRWLVSNDQVAAVGTTAHSNPSAYTPSKCANLATLRRTDTGE